VNGESVVAACVCSGCSSAAAHRSAVPETRAKSRVGSAANSSPASRITLSAASICASDAPKRAATSARFEKCRYCGLPGVDAANAASASAPVSELPGGPGSDR